MLNRLSFLAPNADALMPQAVADIPRFTVLLWRGLNQNPGFSLFTCLHFLFSTIFFLGMDVEEAHKQHLAAFRNGFGNGEPEMVII